MEELWRRLRAGDRVVWTDIGLVLGAVGALCAAVAQSELQQWKFVNWIQIAAAICLVIFTIWAPALRARKLSFTKSQRNRDYSSRINEFRSLLLNAQNPAVLEFSQLAAAEIEIVYCGVDTPDLQPGRQASTIDFDYLAAKIGLAIDTNREAGAELRAAWRSRLTKWNESTNEPDIRLNTPHALVFDDDIERDARRNLLPIAYVNADYAALAAIHDFLRKQTGGGPFQIPRVLGAGGLAVYPPKGEVLLQLRRNSEDSGKLHVFGGNFEPNLGLPGQNFNVTLKDNAEREIQEESGVALSVEGTLVLVHKECRAQYTPSASQAGLQLSKAYLPVHFLGISLDTSQYKRAREDRAAHAEGQITFLSLSELKDQLLKPEEWVLAGWVTVLFWMFLGAPCTAGQTVFSPSKSKALVRDVLNGSRPRRFHFF